MKRIIINLLLKVIRLSLYLFQKISRSEIQQINYLHNTKKLEIEIWDKTDVFDWNRHKKCYFIDWFGNNTVSFWDIEEQFNVLEPKSYE